MSTSTMSRKRKSPEPERDTFTDDQVTTPSTSPARKKLKITQHQKQALVDNLQLEITERARRLRAQYALQAQDLRSRIERRVNRIPVALRKTTMGALLEKQSNTQAQSPKKSVPPAKATRTATSKIVSRAPEYPAINVSKSPSRRIKETSNGGSYSDKENAPVSDVHLPLDNPKKRGNPNASGQPRSVSQVLRDAESKVLSPKSSNSRTYKQSPLITSPTKASYLSRPASPLKPSSPLKAMIEDARARTTRTETKKMATTSPAAVRKTAKATTTTTQTKRTATKSSHPVPVKSPAARPATRQQHDRNMSSSTASSSMSTGTTVVKSTRNTQRATGPTSSAAAKRTAVARSQGPTAAATAKRAAARKANTDAPATGTTGRVLRKRA